MKKVCMSWSKSAKMAQHCVNSQIPQQVHVILGVDFKTVAILPDLQFGEVNEFEPDGYSTRCFVRVANDFATEITNRVESSSFEFADYDLDDELIERDLQKRKDQIPIRQMGIVPHPKVYHDNSKKQIYCRV